MKILFITGSLPPEICGVGDYTAKLIEALRKHPSLHVNTFHKKDWALKNLWRYLREIKSTNSDLYHFQYPTEGYKYSFLPLLLVLFLKKAKVVTTVHELSSRNLSAYIYTQVLIFFSGKVIVTNQVEERHAAKFVFRKKITVIPIGSNICESRYSNRPFSERSIDLANFGHIRPMKGIEDFIGVKKSLGNEVNGAIIGQTLIRYDQYFNGLVDAVGSSEIEFILNKDEKDLADTLADVKIMYLPFSDGVSNRRGSLLAALQNGCIIVTTYSQHKEFNDFFDRFCFLVRSPTEAKAIINALLSGALQPKDSRPFKGMFSWDSVIKLHVNLYHQR